MWLQFQTLFMPWFTPGAAVELAGFEAGSAAHAETEHPMIIFVIMRRLLT
jgi:hypothetical protein